MSTGFFDNWAERGYTENYKKRPGYSGLQEKVVETLDPKESQDIVDLGVGTGTTAEIILSKANCKIYGVDSSEKMLDEARCRLGGAVSYLLSRFQDCSFEEESVDSIVSVLSLHHLTREEKGQLFPRMYSWLKPKGRIILGEIIYSEEEPKDEAAWAEGVIRIGSRRALEALKHGGVQASLEPFESTLNGLKRTQEFKESLATWRKLLETSGFQNIQACCVQKETGDYVISAEK
jgi:cyclopropane fatty-acyl-phospholipid synthase-like methyltransferase